MVIGVAGTDVLQAGISGKDKIITPPADLFHPNEFDLSIFASFDTGRIDSRTMEVPYRPALKNGPLPQRFLFPRKKVTRYLHNAADAGVEADYFFSRFFGLGLEGDWIAGDDVIHSVSASLIARYPFEYGTWGWAPYAMIGGGGQFDGQNAGTGHIGAGAEVRFRMHWGVFAVGRYVIHDSTLNYGLFRLGLRYSF
jgi:hypothetical protein